VEVAKLEVVQIRGKTDTMELLDGADKRFLTTGELTVVRAPADDIIRFLRVVRDVNRPYVLGHDGEAALPYTRVDNLKIISCALEPCTPTLQKVAIG
jgi:hypothetical protein